MALRDPLTGIVIFILSGAIFLTSRQYPPDAALFPQLITGVMMLASAAMIVRGIIRPARAAIQTIDAQGAWKVVAVIALTVLYVVGVAKLGYITSSIVFIPLTAWVLGSRQYLLLAIVTAVFLALLVWLFVFVFSVQLPSEAVLHLLGRN
jgi:hypothetical protein